MAQSVLSTDCAGLTALDVAIEAGGHKLSLLGLCGDKDKGRALDSAEIMKAALAKGSRRSELVICLDACYALDARFAP